jgi:hypothetical protein
MPVHCHQIKHAQCSLDASRLSLSCPEGNTGGMWMQLALSTLMPNGSNDMANASAP